MFSFNAARVLQPCLCRCAVRVSLSRAVVSTVHYSRYSQLYRVVRDNTMFIDVVVMMQRGMPRCRVKGQ